MGQKLTHASGVKEQQGVDHDDTLTRGASGGEGEKCKDKNDVKGGGHHNVQEDTGEDSGLVKDDEVYQHYGDASNLKGATSSESQAPIESKSSNVVSTADLLAGLSLDGSAPLFLQQQEQEVGDEQVGDQQHVVNASQDWSVLPRELVLNLFKFYMKPGDVLSASQTCRLWRILGENDLLWQKKCQEAGLACTLNSADRKIVERRTENTTIDYSPWKVNFLKQFKIERKFRQGVPQVLAIERSQFRRFSLLRGARAVRRPEVFKDKIVCSYANTLYVFSALSGDLLHELVGHTGQVKTFQMDEEFVLSGSEDRSVKVWDVATGSCRHTMRGHTGGVFRLKMHGTIAVSSDGTLRVWDVREGVCLRILSGHTKGVFLVQFDGRLVVSGSWDRTIKIWDPQTGECRRTMIHVSERPIMHSLKFNGTDVVVAGYYDCSIKVWDVDTGDCRHTLVGNMGNVSDWYMELQGNILAAQTNTQTGADRTTAEIWSISNGARLHTLAGAQKHKFIITGTQLNRKFVVTSSIDGTVKLWDIETGEYIRDLLELESGEWLEDMRMKDAKIVCKVVANDIYKILVINFDTNDEDYEVSHGEVKTG